MTVQRRPAGEDDRVIVPSPHSKLGPKFQVYDVVPARVPNPATENEAERGTRPADRHHVAIDPLPGGGR